MGLFSLSAVTINQEQTARCYLVPLVGRGEIAQWNLAKGFQYFPESISDTKASNYQQKEIPGASLPLYQWMNGGERAISFTAVFSCDIQPGIDADGLGVYGFETKTRITDAGIEDRNIDVAAAVAWLRSFLLPFYTTEGALPPHKILLYIPGVFKGLITCLMTQCDVTYEGFWPNGALRYATVQLTFVESPQEAGKVTFPGTEEYMTFWSEKYKYGPGPLRGTNR